jgi:hypothetical protein
MTCFLRIAQALLAAADRDFVVLAVIIAVVVRIVLMLLALMLVMIAEMLTPTMQKTATASGRHPLSLHG